MDFSKAFVASILSGGKDAYKLAVQRGVKPDFIDGQGREAFEYIVTHIKDYQEIPSRDIILGKTGIEIPEADGLASFYVDECLNLRLFTLLKEGLGPATKLLAANKPKDTLLEIQKLIKNINKEHLSSSPSVSIFSMIPEIEKHYADMKAGKRGITLPFPSLNDATLGIWPQDLILFVARLGIGKTWNLVLTANAAWKSGARVLLATTEMSKKAIAQRVFATQLRLPYKHFKRGSLTAFVEDKMHADLKEMMSADDNRFNIIGGDFDFRPETLQAEIDDFMPDVVVFDGAYLMKTEGHNRTEQAANAFNELKRIANTSHTGIVVSSQFNRDVKKNAPDSAQAESIGLTDVAGWNADVIFGLVQTDDMKADRRMRFKPLKVREGEGEEFECIWDIGNMKFEEILKVKPPGFDNNNPFDSGLKPQGFAGNEPTIF